MEEFFERLLDFGSEWKVEKVEFNSENESVEIFVKFQLNAYKTNNKDTYYGVHDYREIRYWRHLNILQYKTFITAKIPRMKDEYGKVLSVKVPWADENERHTYLFEKHVIDCLLATKNQTKTAALVCCGFNIVNRILYLATERGLERRDQGTIYKNLSLDEKSFQKGHNYATVLSDSELGYIIDLVQSRTKDATVELLNNNLSEVQKTEVETIAIDMWKPFISAVDEVLPKSKKVHDRFHLVKYLNEAIDNVRKREIKNNETLVGSRYALLKRTENLTKKQYFKFEEILRVNFEVSQAWKLTECFKCLFGSSDFQDARKRFSDWSSFCDWEKIPEINKVVKMFRNHIIGVCNALVEKASNGMAERLNGKIQELKTIGKGYRTFQNFRNAILFFNGGLNLYPQL